MLNINKKYVVDENNNRLSVEIDVETFNKIEGILEDYALGKYLEESADSESLSLNDARDYYSKLTKNNGN
jgi:hypothetical protein